MIFQRPDDKALALEMPEQIQCFMMDMVDAKSLAMMACTCKAWHKLISSDDDSRAFERWRRLCIDFLGKGICALHEAFARTAGKSGACVNGLPSSAKLEKTTTFWRKLYGFGVAITDVHWWPAGSKLLQDSLALDGPAWCGSGADEPTSITFQENVLGRLEPTWTQSSSCQSTETADPCDSAVLLEGSKAGASTYGILGSLVSGSQGQSKEGAMRVLQGMELLSRSGHSCTQVGVLQFVIGGLSRDGRALMDVLVINLEEMTIRKPQIELINGCDPPQERFRHTATLVLSDGQAAIFLMGGYNLEGEEFGAKDAYMLRIMDGCRGLHVAWHRICTLGAIPTPRYHHCAHAIRGGLCIVAYGGEGSAVLDRSMQAEGSGPQVSAGQSPDSSSPGKLVVYIMDVSLLTWREVATHGPDPGVRTLHLSCIHSWQEARTERLIIFGGYRERERNLADMQVYALNLSTYVWERGPMIRLPASRHRGGLTKLGEHTLAIMGGSHGVGTTGNYVHDFVPLDLRTLTWSEKARMHGKPSLDPTAGHTAENLLLFGGCSIGLLGISPVARMDPVLLGDWRGMVAAGGE